MRKLSDIDTGSNAWPPVGWTECLSRSAAIVTADHGTPYVAVEWEWSGGVFADRLYVSGKALGRLAAFIKRLCPPDDDMDLPDDNDDAAMVMAEWIATNGTGISAGVEIVERPDREGKLRRQVSFAGYRAGSGEVDPPPPGDDEPGEQTPPEDEDDNLPF